MKYMKFTLAALVAAALLSTTTFAATTAVAPVAPTGHDLGQWSLSLSGNSTVTTATPSTVVGGAEFALGHTGDLVLPLELGVRQGIGYTSGNGHNWAFGTKAYVDWTLVKLGNLEFDGGLNGGATYGNTALAWTVAPEAVARLWLKRDVNVFVRGEYPFALNPSPVAQNKVLVALGLQIRF